MPATDGSSWGKTINIRPHWMADKSARQSTIRSLTQGGSMLTCNNKSCQRVNATAHPLSDLVDYHQCQLRRQMTHQDAYAIFTKNNNQSYAGCIDHNNHWSGHMSDENTALKKNVVQWNSRRKRPPNKDLPLNKDHSPETLSYLA